MSVCDAILKSRKEAELRGRLEFHLVSAYCRLCDAGQIV